MENIIYFGIRYGLSSFNHTLNSGIINSDPFLPEQEITTPREFNSLNAHWAEILVGIKAEILHNVYLGFSFSGKK